LADPTLGLKRKDLFITSKLAPKDQGFHSCYNAVLESLRKFNLDYIDLYLIHWPGTQKLALNSPQNPHNRLSSYRALERLHREGRVRAIGVSNYTSRQLLELIAKCEIVPAVNQFELHPLLYISQHEITELCDQLGVHIQAYSSLGEGKLLSTTNPDRPSPISALPCIAVSHNVSEAQVLLRWAVQHGWAVVPKSRSEQRIKTNSELFNFVLGEEEMAVLDAASKAGESRFCWDPTNVL